MAKSLKAASPYGQKAGIAGVLKWLLSGRKRRQAGISHLSERMLRDIGLGERELSKLQQSARREWR